MEELTCLAIVAQFAPDPSMPWAITSGGSEPGSSSKWRPLPPPPPENRARGGGAKIGGTRERIRRQDNWRRGNPISQSREEYSGIHDLREK